MPPKAAQAKLREQYAAESPAAAGIEEGLRTRDTLRLKPPPTADQMPPRARNIAAERQDDVLKGPQPAQLEATPEELGQMFGIEGDLSSGQVPPIPPEKVAVPGRGHWAAVVRPIACLTYPTERGELMSVKRPSQISRRDSSLPSGGFSAMSAQALHHNGRQKKSSGKRSAPSVAKFQV